MSAQFARGETVFIKNCRGCHNKGLNGFNMSKKLTWNDLQANQVNTVALIYRKVRAGGPVMPKFGTTEQSYSLSAQQMSDVSEYVWTQAKNAKNAKNPNGWPGSK